MPTAYTIEELHTLWDEANEKESKPRKRAEQHEHDLQVASLKWLRLAYPKCCAMPYRTAGSETPL